MSDRRSRPRYDIVGSLWGVLELHEEACIRNVSATGALLDSPFPVALDSAQTVRLSVDGQWVAVEAQVRHSQVDPSARFEPRYLVGVEFVSPPTSVVQSIEQLNVTRSSEEEKDEIPSF